MKKVESKEVSKITDEQLEVITKHQKDLNKSLTNIGFLETQKHSLLHEYAGIVDDIEKYKKELEDVYGAININIEDGTYTEIEKEE
jgi:hemerythrin|tara:strand:- start:712 stop:969 length:258 start_codon:yes stop_codon:yes gene_type:complete